MSQPPTDEMSLMRYLKPSLKSFVASSNPFSVLLSIPPSPPKSTTSSSSPHPSTLTILDSSFNPPTKAHLSLIRSSLLNKVLLLLSTSNADKAPAAIDALALRLAMMHALAGEIHAPGGVDIGVTKMAYFADKSRVIARHQQPGNEAAFLVGFDTLTRILDGKYYSDMRTELDSLFGAARLLVMLRPGDRWGGVEEQEAYIQGLSERGEGGLEARGGRTEWLDRIQVMHGVGDAISSSMVREAVRNGDSIDELVTPGVKKLIESEGLYKTDQA